MPLVKLTLSKLKEKQAELATIADKLEALNADRIAKLIEINADASRTLSWKSIQAEKYRTSPELEALTAQARILGAVLEEQRRLWRDSATLLRDAAVPRRDQMGADAFNSSVAELNFLMLESAQLSQNPEALQASLDAAVLREDWRSIYALTIGRIDQWGRALPSISGLSGTPLDPLPIPGKDESEDVLYQAELAKLRCDSVVFNLSANDLDPTADSSRTKLFRGSALLGAERKHAEAIKQRDRLRAAPTALERWAIFKKTGVDINAVPSFEEGLAAATKIYKDRAANIAAGREDATVPVD